MTLQAIVVVMTLSLVASAGFLIGQTPEGSGAPRRMKPPEDSRPNFPASMEVHLTPTTMPDNSTASASAPDFWSSRGFDLKSLIAQVYGVEISRVDFPDEAEAKKRYDVALVLPKEESQETIYHLVQKALETRLHLQIGHEDRSQPVYVLTAPNGPGRGLHPAASGGGMIGSSSLTLVAPESTDGGAPTMDSLDRLIASRKQAGLAVGRVSASGGTMTDLCRELERGLDRLVVDETHLTASYDFNINAEDLTREQFFAMMQQQFGLVLTPKERTVTMLAVRTNPALASP